MSLDPLTHSNRSAVRTVHYILSSHWDREWYQTFQDYRRRLVCLMDRVLDDIQTGRLKGPFTTDGQSILLDDYLEVQPHRRDQITEFAKSGKLKIGPWYVLPDEWLVSGESLIRNLALGRQIAREYGGEPSKAGFVCDLFGHTSQLPQLLGGFGIRAALIWRGLEPRATAHVIWEGADGTALPCYRFGRSGYSDYACDVRQCLEPDHVFEKDAAAQKLKAFLAGEAARTNIPPMLVFDGGDHLEYDGRHYDLLFNTDRSEEFPYDVIHSTLDAYLEEMLAHESSIPEVVKGELRGHGQSPLSENQQWLIPGVLSSRVWIKQANAECQTLLCNWSEPFASLNTLFLGTSYPSNYLAIAWRWLLQNHPHDSICGCSIDEVHEDMKYRFAQCRQIATRQVDESLRLIANSIDGTIPDNELRVVVANALATPLHEPQILTLQIPESWGCYNEFFGFEPKPGFRIFNHADEELPYQLVSQDMAKSKTRIHPFMFPSAYKTNDVTVCVELLLPAMGYTTLTIRQGEQTPKAGYVPVQTLPTRHPQTQTLMTSERSMENETLSVTIENNGSLTITDKRNSQTYTRLLTFEDVADIGDGWYHGPAVNDQKAVSAASYAEIFLVSEGALFCRFRVCQRISLPREFDFGTKRRSSEMLPLVIESLVTLRKGCDRVEIQTTVDNTVKDHRLRALFPSGTKAKTYLADVPFDVVERNIALPANNHLARELAVETTPQQTWTAVTDGDRGLAIVSAGLFESSVRDLPERPIALTLFRSTRRTVLTDGQPQGQLLSKMKFDLWIVPISGGVNRRRLFDQGYQLASDVKAVQLDSKDYSPMPNAAKLSRHSSLLAISGDAVTTSVRHVEGQLEVRLFNPTNRMIHSELTFDQWPSGIKKPETVVRVNMESDAMEKEKEVGASIPLSLKPKEIVTLRFA